MATKLEPNARSIAAHVIERVLREKAFAAAVLDAALERYPELDPREKGLATELAYGALRTAPYLETRLSNHATRGFGKVDATVRAHLLVAAYQLLFLERVPPFAAVSEAVRQVGGARGKRVGAFANAVLRRLSEEAPGDKRKALEEAERDSAAPWLREALVRALGEGGASSFLGSGGAPTITLRIRSGADRTESMARLAEEVEGASFEAGALSPLAISMRAGKDPEKLSLYREGKLAIHEEGAQVIALSLGAEPGERVLDACAGRGNKSALLVEIVGQGGAVDAADQHPQKLDRLRLELLRLGLSPHATFAVDWAVGTGDVPSNYDRVLIDAPCSGTGTLRRRPDLATHRQAAELGALADLQVAILVSAASRAKEGGAILYAVCSVLREEAEEVIERARALAPFLVPAPFPGGPARTLANEATTLRLLPHLHGTDGYFLASFVRAAL
ncbi:MAG TPA: transcription antitermination factor NusB [Polyangiaceae bacterium]|nr:transcription antitermination factor NusB [Polyangiaceae bacterium]